MTMKITPNDTPTSAVAYLRVSTNEQADSQLGLKAQKESIQNFAKSQGLRIRKYYTDAGISGAKGVQQRPALSEMLSDLKPNTVVIVHKLDRLSRDTFLNLWIEKECGKVSCQILSASGEGNGDSATDRLLRGIISNFAMFERELISQRTKQAMAKLNKPVGRPPYGFRYDSMGRLIKHSKEYGNFERIVELHKELGNQWSKISNAMNSEERFTQKGKEWRRGTVQHLILRVERKSA